MVTDSDETQVTEATGEKELPPQEPVDAQKPVASEQQSAPEQEPTSEEQTVVTEDPVSEESPVVQEQTSAEQPVVEPEPISEEPAVAVSEEPQAVAEQKASKTEHQTPVMGSEEQESKLEQEEEAAEEKEESSDDSILPPLDEKRSAYPWYVVHTYSGYEQRAKLSLEERVKIAGATEKFGHVVVPQEKVVEVVRGEKKTSSRKVFPGYMLVQCDLDEEAWHLVKDTPKITGFVGDSNSPVPLSKLEVETLMKQMEGGAERARPSVEFEQGDSVKIVDGPFADFNGTVDDVKPDKGKLRVLISIFGRNTPVELDFVQVEKV